MKVVWVSGSECNGRRGDEPTTVRRNEEEEAGRDVEVTGLMSGSDSHRKSSRRHGSRKRESGPTSGSGAAEAAVAAPEMPIVIPDGKGGWQWRGRLEGPGIIFYPSDGFRGSRAEQI